MPAENYRRFPARQGERRVLRTAAILLSTATMLGGIGISVANGEPSAPASLCGVPTIDNATSDITEIKQLKTSYFANIDAKNWTALRELLAPDIVVDTTCSAGPILTGRDPFIEFLKLTLGGAETHHQGFDPKIKLTSATTAEAVWTLEDILIFGDAFGVHGYGHYYDKYEKVDGQWVEKYSKLTRTRFDLINPDGTVIQADAPLDVVVQKFHEATGL